MLRGIILPFILAQALVAATLPEALLARPLNEIGTQMAAFQTETANNSLAAVSTADPDDTDVEINRLRKVEDTLRDLGNRYEVERRRTDEVAVARQRVALSEKVRALRRSILRPEADSNLAYFADVLNLRDAKGGLGDALYRAGKLAEAEAIFRGLAADLAQRLLEKYPKGQHELDGLIDRDLLRFRILSGSDDQLPATIARIDELAGLGSSEITREVFDYTLLEALTFRGEGLIRSGSVDAGVKIMERSLELARRSTDPESTARITLNRYSGALEARAFAMEDEGDQAAALTLFQRAHAVLAAHVPADDAALQVATANVVSAELLKRRDPSATIEDALRVWPPFTDYLHDADTKIFRLLMAMPEELGTPKQWKVQRRMSLYDLYARTSGVGHPRTVMALAALAAACHQDHRLSPAIVFQTRVIEGYTRLLGEDSTATREQRALLNQYLTEKGGSAQPLTANQNAPATPHATQFASEMAALAKDMSATGASAGSLQKAGADIAQLEAEAMTVSDRIIGFHSNYRTRDGVGLARTLVALRARISNAKAAATDAKGNAEPDYEDVVSMRSAHAHLGKALYRDGKRIEAEPIFARLAADVRRRKHEFDLASGGKLDSLTECDLLRFRVLAGTSDAAINAELALVEARIPSSKRNGRDINYSYIMNCYVEVLLLRAEGAIRESRLSAATKDFGTAIERAAQIEGENGSVTRPAIYRYAAALENEGKRLSMAGDRAGASILFHHLATFGIRNFGASGVENVYARNLVKIGDALRDRSRTLTLAEAALVFPGWTELIPDAERKELDTLHGFPTDESLRSDRKVASNQRQYELYEQWLGGGHPLTIQQLSFLAHSLNADGQSEKSLELQVRVVERTALLLGERNAAVLDSRASLGTLLYKKGKAGDAIKQLVIAVDGAAGRIAAGERSSLFTAYALHNLLFSQGRYADALVIAELLEKGARNGESLSADSIAEDLDNFGEPFAEHMALIAAEDLRSLKRFTGAERWDRKALAQRTKRFGGRQINTSIVNLWIAADLLPQRGRAREAYRLAKPAYLQQAALMRQIWADYEISSLKTFMTARTIATDGRLTLLDAAFALYADKSPASAEPDFNDSVFAALQDSFYSSPALAVAHNAARRYALSIGAGELVTRREGLARNGAAAWTALDRSDGPRHTSGDIGRATDVVTANLSQFAKLSSDLKARAPRYETIVAQPPLSVTAAQELMKQDEATLLIVPFENGTHIMVVTRDGFSWHHSAMNADQISTMVARLRRDLVPNGSAPGAYDRQTAWVLYRELVKPMASALAGKTTLYVVAGGALDSLPLNVLVTRPPAVGANDADPEVLRRTDWLANMYALVELPSLRALALEREVLKGVGSPPQLFAKAPEFAGYGDPVLADAPGSGDVAIPPAMMVGDNPTASTNLPLMNAAFLRALGPLPDTARELDAMRKMLGAPTSALHMGAAMREGTFRTTDLSHVRVLHLATHGLTASESGDRNEPGLVFTPPAQPSAEDDGYLAATEVAELNLASAEWVILSACNSAAAAGGDEKSGLSGLARAFMLAGARSLLVSHWQVDDAVAARLTVDVLRRVQTSGVTRARALQDSIRSVREDRSDPYFSHPQAWAPFALVGEGR